MISTTVPSATAFIRLEEKMILPFASGVISPVSAMVAAASAFLVNL